MENNSELVLVTGANGHLGNNLTHLLVSKGFRVRATVRNLQNKAPFEGLDCELVQADITDKTDMVRVMQGVHTLYAVAAVFKLWAKDPIREIYDVNMQGTRNTIEAAAEAGVKRIVYVSSIASLNYSKSPINEASGYNPDRRDTYYNSKNDSDKLALELASKYKLDIVMVLPSAMIGGLILDKLSTSNQILKAILEKEVPVETNIVINWIDVKDVAMGCYQAAAKGRDGERYILANEKAMSITNTIALANQQFPQLKIKKPIPVPKFVLYMFAAILGVMSRITGKPPLMTTKEISMYYGLKQDFDISKARHELGFNPKSPEQTVTDALAYMMENHERLHIKI